LANGRQPQYFGKWKTTYIVFAFLAGSFAYNKPKLSNSKKNRYEGAWVEQNVTVPILKITL
jgi:hypothetical protein